MQDLLHMKKCLRNQAESHKQITNYMTLPLTSSLQMNNKAVRPLLILKLKSTLGSLPLLKDQYFMLNKALYQCINYTESFCQQNNECNSI